MRSSHRSTTLLLPMLLLLPRLVASQSAPAAAPAPADLDGILARLQANVLDFQRSVPAFFCSEHVVSEMQSGSGGMSSKRTTTDSIFRVRRVKAAAPASPTAGPPIPDTLNESRVVQMIDGKPQTREEAGETPGVTGQLDSPIEIFGVFSGGLGLVSTAAKGCFQFRLHPARQGHDGGNIVIDFQSLPRKARAPDCPYEEQSSGRAFVDPALMRTVRLDSKTNDHEILPGLRGVWEWTVEYGPVTLDGKEFWLPKTIRSSEAGDRGQAVALPQRGQTGNYSGADKVSVNYNLVAKYSEYHRLTVSSKIVPVAGEGVSPDTPPKP